VLPVLMRLQVLEPLAVVHTHVDLQQYRGAGVEEQSNISTKPTDDGGPHPSHGTITYAASANPVHGACKRQQPRSSGKCWPWWQQRWQPTAGRLKLRCCAMLCCAVLSVD
jgi:hypothetical protein